MSSCGSEADAVDDGANGVCSQGCIDSLVQYGAIISQFLGYRVQHSRLGVARMAVRAVERSHGLLDW